MIRHQKDINELLEYLKTTISTLDYNDLKQYLYHKVKEENEKVTKIHEKKIQAMNNDLVGQEYESLKTNFPHNIWNYKLTTAEERLLCRGKSCCIEKRITNYVNFRTDMEINVCQIEQLTNLNRIKTICQKLHGFSQQLMETNKNKTIKNLRDKELHALQIRKRNKDIITCKADESSVIVIMDQKN